MEESSEKNPGGRPARKSGRGGGDRKRPSQPKDFQAFRRRLRPRIRALRGYLSETVRCSSAFYAAVLTGIHSVPDDFHEFLFQQGRRMQIGDRLTHMDPSLRGLQPRGWPLGTTWAAVGGCCHRPPKNRVLVAETIERRGKLIPTWYVEAICREELGHALDFALDQGPGPVSSTDAEFLTDYYAEAAAITDAQIRSELDYLLQPGSAGREEAFASLFALMYGGAVGSAAFQALLRQTFPHTLHAVGKILPP